MTSPPRPTEETHAEEAHAPEPIQVLVVEDNDSERWLLAEILRSRGHVVTACEDAESGWEMYQEQHFPLVLLDWVLPGESGVELCRRIRAHPRGDQSVVIIVTGHDRPEVLAEALDAGADDYIAKPVEVGALNIRLGLAERGVQELARRQATASALERTSQELKTLFYNLSEVAFSVDLVGQRLIQVSPAAERIFGIAPPILLSRPELWPEFLYPSGWVSLEARLRDLAPGESLTVEYEVVRPDGETRWLEGRLKTERGPDGSLVRLDGVLADQTAAGEAREELAARNEELVTMYRAAEITQSAGSVREACDEVLRELIRSTHAHSGWVCLHEEQTNTLRILGIVGGPPDWTPPESMLAHETVEGVVLRTGRWVKIDDVGHRPEARHELYIDLGARQIIAFPLRSEGDLLGVLTLARGDTAGFPDRTIRLARGIAHHLSGFLQRRRTEGAMEESHEDYKALAAQLQRVNSELEAFTYTVSHDLRAPLRTMQGFAHALLRNFGDDLDPQAQDYARRIITSGESLEALIADLLDYSRLSFEDLEFQTVSIAEVVVEAREQVQAVLREADAQLTVDGALPDASGNHRTLVQVIGNLLSNAAKFVPENRKPNIHVSAEPREGWIRLWIRDNGTGIPEDQRERIFRTFERGRDSHSSPGTGIGLAIVRKGMERVGGSVGVESAEGEGSAFWLDIPAKNQKRLRTKPWGAVK